MRPKVIFDPEAKVFTVKAKSSAEARKALAEHIADSLGLEEEVRVIEPDELDG